eukprot:878115-Prorocentrum_minimum.AAC.1
MAAGFSLVETIRPRVSILKGCPLGEPFRVFGGFAFRVLAAQSVSLSRSRCAAHAQQPRRWCQHIFDPSFCAFRDCTPTRPSEDGPVNAGVGGGSVKSTRRFGQKVHMRVVGVGMGMGRGHSGGFRSQNKTREVSAYATRGWERRANTAGEGRELEVPCFLIRHDLNA